MKRLFRRSLLPTLLCLSASSFACDKGEQKEKKPDEDVASESAIKVELPPSPNFEEGKVDEKYPDGSWSIYGLRQEIDENIKAGEAGTEIEVKGYVQEIYTAPECEEEPCPPGKQPHLWITDNAEEGGKKRAMMVVSYAFTIPEYDVKRWKDVPNVILNKGQQYTFKGRFKRFSDQGFADDRGLLEFIAYKDVNPKTEQMEWIYPPGAAWHPLELARQEEEQKKLIEASAKAAAARSN
jgi:hypothetical protein